MDDWVQLVGGAALGTACNGLASLLKLMHDKYYSAIEMKGVLEDLIPILEDLPNEEDESASDTKIGEFQQKVKDSHQRIANSSPRSFEGLSGLSKLEDYVNNFSTKFGWLILLTEMRKIRKEMRETEKERTSRGRGNGVPNLQTLQLPRYQVGLTDRVRELKKLLFKENVKTVEVRAMGGSGKTTLVAALCQDPEVKDHFKGNTIFESVSQNPTSIKKILESIWKKINNSKGGKKFRNVEDARNHIEELLQKKSQPTLVVLDDVWSLGDLRQLLFEAPEYKTVVTTREKFKLPFDACYDLRLLEKEDALSLFCFWAFGIDRIPERGYDKTLVKQVAAECKGLPLALKVVGTSLNEEPEVAWMAAKNQLSNSESISDEHEEGLLKRLAMSYTGLKDDVKKCFLDLGLFPEDKKIPVDSLFDIWIHVHNLDWIRAYQILLELEKRNLLVLVNDHRYRPGTTYGRTYGNTCELYVVQHDVLRDLAIYLAAKRQPVSKCKMLIMPRKEVCIPKSWEKHSTAAEIISIHTGSMNEEQWPEMKFPKARVLLLIFTGTDYFLPPFLKTMAELEVLIIIKQNSGTTKLEGMSAFTSLTQLKSVRLERLTVPPLESYSQYLKNLKKLSLSLCKGNDESNHGLDIEMCSKLPGLVEINIDHCMDIKELPASVCTLSSLEKLSMTNCHELNKLPEDLGNLAGSLVMLMLGACPALKALPDSICKLEQLQFLDISQCGRINKLPNELGKLQSLKAIDIRETDFKVKKLPQSATTLKSLSRVICDQKNKYQWEKIKDSLPDLQVEIAEQNHNLGWLET